jgi:hypothetical protein
MEFAVTIHPFSRRQGALRAGFFLAFEQAAVANAVSRPKPILFRLVAGLAYYADPRKAQRNGEHKEN